MLKKIYLVQMIALGASLVPSLVCFLVKAVYKGATLAENFLMALLLHVALVIFAWIELSEKYTQMNKDSLNDRTLLNSTLQLLNS